MRITLVETVGHAFLLVLARDAFIVFVMKYSKDKIVKLKVG